MKSPYVIAGLGKSGNSAKNYLLASGISASEIYTLDEKSPADFSNWSDVEKLNPAGTLVVSPGVPLDNAHLKQLVKNGWNLTSEINLAASKLTTEIVIGITGSVGKSTVTSLLGAAVQHDDPHAFVGGNLGIPFCEYAIGLLNNKPKAKYVVLELSSYQLENAQKLQLDYSAITFLSANHLERYPSLEAYYRTKLTIADKTKNLCFINATSSELLSYQSQIRSANAINFESSRFQKEISKGMLIGSHNRDNMALAYQIAKALHLSDEALNKILNFSGLSHRLETVGLFEDVLYINDSKATAMDSVLVATQAALEKVSEQNHLYLLLGGKDKNLPWNQLNVLKSNAKINFVFFGACGPHAKQMSQLEGDVFSNLKSALETVFNSARAGDVVLLSPGGTSLDEFKNFEDRGNIFKEHVKTKHQK